MKAFGSVARPAGIPEERLSHAGEDQRAGLVRSGQPGVGSRVPGFRGLPTLAPEPSRLPIGTGNRPQLPDVRLLVVDDCLLHRENLAAALVAAGLPVVGFAWDLATLVMAIRDSQIDIVLFNIATADSAALVGVASTTDPGVRVVVLGVPDDDEQAVVACAEAGVAGYHTRRESFEDLLALITRVAAGESVCPPKVSAILLRRLSSLANQQSSASKSVALTAREDQILGMLKMGMSNREIATDLSIAVHTVKNHVHSLLTKLGVGSRAQAVALTLRYDVLVPENQSQSG